MGKKIIPQKDPEHIIRYRLGMRLRTFHWPIDRQAVFDTLEQLRYNEIDTSDQSINATKSGNAFYFNHPKMVLGFIAKKMDKIISAQKEFFSVVERDHNANLLNYMGFYEVEYSSTYHGEQKNHESLNKTYSDSRDLNKFRENLGRKVRPHGVDLVSGENEQNEEKWFRVTVEPKLEGNEKAYFCRTIFRDKVLNNVISDGKKSSEYIKKIISELEKK